jgi:hypothetical protein
MTRTQHVTIALGAAAAFAVSVVPPQVARDQGRVAWLGHYPLFRDPSSTEDRTTGLTFYRLEVDTGRLHAEIFMIASATALIAVLVSDPPDAGRPQRRRHGLPRPPGRTKPPTREPPTEPPDHTNAETVK